MSVLRDENLKYFVPDADGPEVAGRDTVERERQHLVAWQIPLVACRLPHEAFVAKLLKVAGRRAVVGKLGCAAVEEIYEALAD